MKRWLIPLIFLSGLAFGQSGPNPDQNCAAWGAAAPASNLSCNNTGPFVSGSQQFLPDIRGTITNQFEVVVIGTAPASLTVTVVGCMRGGTCSSTLGSSSGTASQIITPTAANLNVFDKYGVTVSWTGGDATTRFVVNRTGTVARLQTGAAGSGTVSANNTAAGAVANYAAAGGSTTVQATTLNYVAPTLTVSTAGGGNGVLALSGNTSGTATITAPAVAGTTTNPIAISNVITVPTGAPSGPSIGFAGDATTGIRQGAAGLIQMQSTGTVFGSFSTVGVRLISTIPMAWVPGADPSVSADTGMSRDAAGVIDIGTGAASNTQGKLKAAGYMSVGTTFTSNAGCTESALTGGATVGKFTVGQATACTIVITMGNSATSPTGWSCWAYDQTAVPAVAIRQTASTTTTASLLMTVATNDVVTFGCVGY